REPRSGACGNGGAAPRGGARMSGTPAPGLAAPRVAGGIRPRERQDPPIVRSVAPAGGGGGCSRPKGPGARRAGCREHPSLAAPQAVVISSGVANAATGERGVLDAQATTAEAARHLELTAEEVLPLSTGVIGARLPLHKLLPGLEEAAVALSEDGGTDAAEAIMTTDTKPNTAVSAGSAFT